MELADRVTSTLIQCRWTGLKYHGLCCNCSWKNTFSQNIHSLGSIRAFLFPTTSIRPPWARINSRSRRSSSSHHSRVRRSWSLRLLQRQGSDVNDYAMFDPSSRGRSRCQDMNTATLDPTPKPKKLSWGGSKAWILNSRTLIQTTEATSFAM